MQPRYGMFGIFFIKTHYICDTTMYFNSKNIFYATFFQNYGDKLQF